MNYEKKVLLESKNWFFFLGLGLVVVGTLALLFATVAACFPLLPGRAVGSRGYF